MKLEENVENKKSILMITAFPPCSRTAGQNYTKRVIEELVRSDYDVSLISFEYPGHAMVVTDTVHILKVCRPNMLNCIKHITYHPFFTKRYDSKLVRYIQKISNMYDLVYFDFSQVMIYSIFLKHPLKLFMCHDIIYQRYSRRKIPFNVYLIKKTESRILNHGDRIFTFSKKDCKLLEKNYNVNSQPVNFYLKTDKSFKYDGVETKANLFCFYGAWNRKENIESLIWFINKVSKRIVPKIKYIVIGGGMDEKNKLKIESDKRFKVIGYVDNPLNEIAKCQALIAPLKKGAGVKVKVVDTLTTGTPVIGTDVAFEGIGDNSNITLFKHATKIEDYINILNGWQFVDKKVKELAAEEFYNRYNANHIVEIINEEMLKKY